MTETLLGWIIGSGLAMSAIALVGSVVLVLKEETLNRLLLPLVAFAAGNFLYIGAADLVPEVNKSPDFAESAAVFSAFLAGGLLRYWIGGA